MPGDLGRTEDRNMIFIFRKPWEHAGIVYADGDAAELPESDCKKLARLGAGETDEPKPKRKRK